MQTDRNETSGWNSRNDQNDRSNSYTMNSRDEDRYIDDTDADWNVNQSIAQSNANRNEDRDQDRYSDDRKAVDKNTDKYHDKDSKTFNEDEESWKNKKDAETETPGTEDNDWDANDAMQRGTASANYDDTLNYKASSRYDDYDDQRDAASGDYINSDHSDYNRGDPRFRWDEPLDE